MLRRTFFAAAAAMTLVVAGTVATPALAQDAKVINIGFISTESSSNLKNAWQPVIDDLSKALGVQVKPFFASDYSGIIEGMRFNKVQVAWFGNKSAIEAVDRANGEVFASVIDKDGNPGYWSVLLVNKDSDLKSVEDVIRRGKDLSYGAGDPNSTSGTAVPGYYLWAANKVEPKTLFKAVRIANHETNLLSVMNKQVDVAVANTEAIERYRISTGKNALDQVRVLWKSPLIPADPLVYRKDLPADTKARIKTFFVNYGKGPDAAREKQLLSALTYQGFRPSTDAQLVPIRQLDLAKEKAKIEADTSMAAADKEKQLADVSRRLAELDKLAASAQ
ncbi:phosphonate ABC transporter substrate-binding protein [Cupriavidus plantarum]|uniref:phosphonate ABC transporter substrate-binding protein n=1 Tax=Cupriavidus plantarum TaxID=942865 RepID=UPI00339DA0B8